MIRERAPIGINPNQENSLKPGQPKMVSFPGGSEAKTIPFRLPNGTIVPAAHLTEPQTVESSGLTGPETFVQKFVLAGIAAKRMEKYYVSKGYAGTKEDRKKLKRQREMYNKMSDQAEQLKNFQAAVIDGRKEDYPFKTTAELEQMLLDFVPGCELMRKNIREYIEVLEADMLRKPIDIVLAEGGFDALEEVIQQAATMLLLVRSKGPTPLHLVYDNLPLMLIGRNHIEQMEEAS